MKDLRELLAPIKARLAAATPGPWHWRNTQGVYLMGARTRVVMGFARMGMQGAQPQFVNDDGIFIDAGKENLHAIPDAAFIENAPADLSRLLAAIEAVEALHTPTEVYEYDDSNGVFKTDADGEQIVMKTLCQMCTGDSVLEDIGDCEYDDLDYHDEVHWPCPTIIALAAALESGS